MKRPLLLVVALTLAVACPFFALAQHNPAPHLIAHEWGVWKINAGEVTLQALVDESPPFVVRSENIRRAPTPRPPVVRRGNPEQVALKPVLFLRSDVPIDNLRVDVRFAGGRPWLHFPAGRVRRNRISWRGSLRPAPTFFQGGRDAGLSPAPAGHWWNHLRAAGGDTFVSRGTSAAAGRENFIFYDGPVAFPTIIETGDLQRPGGSELDLSTHLESGAETLRARRQGTHAVWVVDANRVVEYRVTRRASEFVRRGDLADLRRWITSAANDAGLTAAETESLVRTWSGELFASDGPLRLVYFLPRAQYDRMLPLRIVPTPSETVRVGLVLHQI